MAPVAYISRATNLATHFGHATSPPAKSSSTQLWPHRRLGCFSLLPCTTTIILIPSLSFAKGRSSHRSHSSDFVDCTPTCLDPKPATYISPSGPSSLSLVCEGRNSHRSHSWNRSDFVDYTSTCLVESATYIVHQGLHSLPLVCEGTELQSNSLAEMQ